MYMTHTSCTYMYVSHICVLHTYDILHIHTSYIYMYTTYYHMLPHTIYLAFEYQYGDGRSMYHILLYIFEIYIYQYGVHNSISNGTTNHSNSLSPCSQQNFFSSPLPPPEPEPEREPVKYLIIMW